MSMNDINNAAAAQNALTGRINVFMDGLDADEVARNQRVDTKIAEMDTWKDNAEDQLTHMHEWVVTVDGDVNTFYPVVLAQDGGRTTTFEISRHYASGAGGDTGRPLMALHSRFYSNGGSWGGNPCKLIPQFHAWRYQEAMALAGMVKHAIQVGFWLRGGGYPYIVRSTFLGANPQVHLAKTKIHDSENDIYDWYVEPVQAVDASMVPNDFGMGDAFASYAPNQA